MKAMKKSVKKKIKLHIRKGDRVKVLAGRHRSEEGVVLQVFPERYRASVVGMQMVTKHIKPSVHNPKGSLERREASMHLSNLMLIDPATGAPTRVSRRYNASGKLQRYSKKSGNFIKND